MDRVDQTGIVDGMNVYSVDGEKLGSIVEVSDRYLVIEKGWFFPKDYYIPRNVIARQDADGVVLNVTKDAALNQGWDAVPADYDTVAATGATTVSAVDSDRFVETADRDDTDAPLATGSTLAADQDTLTIPVREEELIATKRSEEIGAVQLEKVVTTEERALDVPVTEERVRVTRRVVDRVASADDADAFTETVVEVPVYGEEVELAKRARVVEEVEVAKEAVSDTRRVSGTVRREDVRVVDNVDAGVEGVIDDQSAVIDPGATTRDSAR